MTHKDVLSYSEMVRAAAAERPDFTAIQIGDERRTYAELCNGASDRARELAALGLKSGDRLGLLLPNSIEFVETMIAAAMLGVVTVPINTRFKSFETSHVVRDSQMTAIITTDAVAEHADFPALLLAALPGLDKETDPLNLQIEGFPFLRAVLLLGAARKPFTDRSALRERAQAARFPETGPSAEAPFLLMYTSGTTANPKACIISSRAFVGTAMALAGRYKITRDDVWWCPLPMFHCGGILFMTTMFSVAGFYVGMSHFQVDATFDTIEAVKPTIFYPLFPPITLAIMDHPRFARTSFDSVRYVFSVAPEDVQLKVQSAFPQATLCSAFGMTEACGAVTFSLPDDSFEDRTRTCGTALPGWDFRVVDSETRRPVSTEERGEIEIRGVGLFDGYFNDPEMTAKSFTEDGFFRTGDIGSLDMNGRLRFHGRFKDQLKVGGENVSALEVESFLCSHPAVKVAQVIGTPDERMGEVPVAFIELMSGHKLTAKELLAYCEGKIARYKIPRHVRFVTEWPMSATKVMKHKLRERFLEEQAFGTGVP
ncbi:MULTISPECIES: class I adenylate-forming enzyme family protein [unclassified Chelatococcus]|uniref:class I adenylate-forming enzyme family protein n=1 Tax=unclassified Chelatococcus TaxID=2638111 RepID=UPI001BCB37B3|nr:MULTISPECIES: class I adenylate-forming enzyme family protein [unclassified Chelatococcus]MBS7743487.1 acyl--CoA ligase [Chelatococcus sp. HY11]MBX3547073.1 acyl--CoA ligase [Chelatococcus sp.]CAH1662500.1 Fatty-acyl-CoA synthase [Hyphomicrobiales bacterium]CAH1687664.1 Fatty-acyl-CoA synthase [Hyphomicrobiales bacterium]